MSALQCPARVFLARHGETEYETDLVTDDGGSLTPAGRAVLSQCDVRIDGLEARMLAALGPADIETLRKALGACVRSLADASGRFRR